MVFRPASAQIENNGIVVWSDEITEPRYIRYAFMDYAEVNVYNSCGLPLIPFRTDNERF